MTDDLHQNHGVHLRCVGKSLFNMRSVLVIEPHHVASLQLNLLEKVETLCWEHGATWQDLRPCRIEGRAQWKIENLDDSHKVNLMVRLRDGRLVPCSQRAPIAKAIRKHVAIEDAVIAAGGIWDHSTIDSIIVDAGISRSRPW